jgi:intein/homing endonuclease
MVGDLGDMVLRVESSKLRIEHYAAAQQVICGKNDTRHAINAAIREFLGRSGPLPEDGDRVIILRNNKEHGLVNGMMGVALSGARSYNSKSGTIRFDCELEDGRQMVLEALEPYFSAPQNQDALYEKCPAWSRRDNQHVDYAWAITAHKCMTLDTIVHTDRGIMRISELDNGAARGEFKPLEGVSVETGTGLENAASFYNEGPAPVLRVETARGYSVRVTPGHRIFVLGENAELVERLAADVRPGDYVPIPRRTNGFGPDRQPLGYVDEGGYHNESYYTLPEFMSPYLAEFIGMVVADGSVTGRKVNYCKHEREPVARFAELANVLFGYRAKVVDRSKNGYAINDHMCEIHSTLIHRFMASFEGVLPDAKDVPKAILRSNKECQRMFLKGVAEDGTVNVRGGRFDHIEIEMKRESMFENVRAMLQNFGVLCSRYVDQKGYFRLMIYRESAVQFLREIGFHSPSKQANLLTAEIGDHSYSLEAFPHLGGAVKKLLKENRLNRQKVIRPPTLGDSATFNIVSRVIDQLPELAGQPLYDNLADILANYTFDKIVAVEADGVESTVCLEVPSTGAFVQNGILAGNSQGSQYTSGIVLYEPLGRTDELRRRWYYTAITRFEQNVIVAC